LGNRNKMAEGRLQASACIDELHLHSAIARDPSRRAVVRRAAAGLAIDPGDARA
jgi:hypothetical protein